MDILSLFQGIFPTQESNWGLLHCRWLFTSWATRGSNSITHICHIFFMSLSADWHLGYFCILVALSNIYNSALNIWVHLSFVSFWISVSVFFKQIWRIGTSWYYSNSNFSFLKKPHTAFHNVYSNLYEHQQCTRVPFSVLPWQYLSFAVFLMIAILISVRWPFIMACISLINSSVAYFFKCLLEICMSLGNNLCRYSVHLKAWFFFFLLLFVCLFFAIELYELLIYFRL